MRNKSLTIMCVAMIGIPSFGVAASYSSQFLDIHPELKPDPDRPGASMSTAGLSPVARSAIPNAPRYHCSPARSAPRPR